MPWPQNSVQHRTPLVLRARTDRSRSVRARGIDRTGPSLANAPTHGPASFFVPEFGPTPNSGTKKERDRTAVLATLTERGGNATLAVVPTVSVRTRRLIGWACVAVGIVSMLLGYAGVSGTSLVAKQLPYVISGGVFGVALIAMGGALVGRRESRHGSDRLAQVEAAMNEVQAVLLTRAQPAQPAQSAQSAQSAQPKRDEP